jgi:hypothetical protein
MACIIVKDKKVLGSVVDSPDGWFGWFGSAGEASSKNIQKA